MKVSVVIPAYNTQAYIRTMLDSVLEQANDDVEIILVDDGSTDNTLEIVKSYGSRVRWYSQTNAGVSAARNRGIELSTGQIIFFFDSDDVMLPGKIEQTIELFDRMPELALVFTNFCSIDSAGQLLNDDFMNGYDVIRELSVTKLSHYVLPSEFAYSHLINANFIGTPGVAVRREVLKVVGEFDCSYRCGEDWDLWMRIAEKYDICYLPIKSFAYRLHPIRSSVSRPKENLTSRIGVFQKHLAKSSDRILRRNLIKKIGACYFSLAYVYYCRGEMRRARAMLRRIDAGVSRRRIWAAWLKCVFMPQYLVKRAVARRSGSIVRSD